MVALQAQSPKSSKTQLGRLLRQVLSDQRISYSQLGAAVGISKQMVGFIVKGDTIPDRNKIPHLAAGLSRLSQIPLTPEDLEYLIKVDVWGTIFLKDLHSKSRIVKYPELAKRIEDLRVSLGEVEFVKRCQNCRIRPEELKAAEEGYIPNRAAAGPVAALFDEPLTDFFQYISDSDDCDSCCDQHESIRS